MIEIEHITSWCEVLLGEISHRITKGTTPTSLGFGFTNKGILFVKVESLVNQRINHTLCTFIDSNTDEALARSRLQEGDVLISIAGTLGRVAIVQKNDIPANTNQAIAIIRLVEPISSKYIAQFLLSQLLEAQIQKQGRGVGLQNLNLQQVSEFAIPLPPLNEQRRIVAKIEALKARSQRVNEALEDIPQLLNQFRQSLLAAAFRGDLTADWREQNSNVEPNSTENIPPLPFAPPIVIGEVETHTPLGWSWVPLIDVATLESGHTPRKSVPEYWEGGNVPWICLQDIRAAHGKIIYETLYMPTMLGIENSSARLLPEGTVCFSRDISVGFVTIMGRSMATTQHFANWICGSKLFNQYLMYAFMAASSSLIQLGEGTTVRTIYMPALKRMQILLPPIEEQKEIVHQIESLYKAVDIIKQQYQEIKANLDQLDQSILAKAFRGELVPQDPNDEPASILLERIRAERDKLNSKTAKKSPNKTGGDRSKKTQQPEEESVQMELGLE